MAGFIYITGCDGTGKTTQTRLLVDQFRTQGINVKHIWLRFPFFFSLALLFYARLRGLSWYEQNGSVRLGYWDFRSSWIMRNLFPWVLLIDASIVAFLKIYISLWAGKTILCERFVYDMLVDLSIAFNDHHFIEKIPGRFFLRLLPKNSIVVILTLDLQTLKKRRLDLTYDQRLNQRLHEYEKLASRNFLPIISTESNAYEVNYKIQEIMRIENEKGNRSSTNKYAEFKTLPIIKAVMRYPISGIFVHWLLQCMLYMDRTELIFKIWFEVSVFLIIFFILNFGLSIIQAFIFALLISHTVNFLFNAQLFVVLKHYGLVHHSEKEFSNYIFEFKKRLSREPSIRYAAIYGSFVRGRWRSSSDLDVRLVRESGWIAGLRACAFLVRERTVALFSGFPLDIYVLDNNSRLNSLSQMEDPLILILRE
jgi:thymidylate kinase/predicted nucleotidyltransferase